jgi:hypothetical protein
MEGRGLTNLLLAVIAGVLLFGKDAVTGSLQWLFIIGAVLLVLYLIFRGIAALVSSIAEMYRSDEDWISKLWSTIGLVFMFIAMPLLGYAGLLWLDGVERPLHAAMDSKLGTVWQYVFFGALGIMALVVVVRGLRELVANRAQVPSYGMAVLRWLSVASLAPYAFPAREWRFRTEQGSRSGVRILSTAYVAVVATVLWLFGLLIAFGFAMLALRWAGLIG